MGYPNTPVFFFDLNFDGKNELILCQPAQGQRGRTIYSVFDAKGKRLTGKPYDKLDSETRINPTTKEISFNSSGGACGSITEVYQSQNGDLQLAKITKHNREGDKCMKFTYEVTNGKYFALINSVNFRKWIFSIDFL